MSIDDLKKKGYKVKAAWQPARNRQVRDEKVIAILLRHNRHYLTYSYDNQNFLEPIDLDAILHTDNELLTETFRRPIKAEGYTVNADEVADE